MGVFPFLGNACSEFGAVNDAARLSCASPSPRPGVSLGQSSGGVNQSTVVLLHRLPGQRYPCMLVTEDDKEAVICAPISTPAWLEAGLVRSDVQLYF